MVDEPPDDVDRRVRNVDDWPPVVDDVHPTNRNMLRSEDEGNHNILWFGP